MKIIVYSPYRVWAERVSSFGKLASCSDKRSGDRLHPDCVSTGGLMRCHRRRMTGRTGLRHRDSQGIDTSHTSKSHWAVRRLPSETHHLNLLSVPMVSLRIVHGYQQWISRRRHNLLLRLDFVSASGSDLKVQCGSGAVVIVVGISGLSFEVFITPVVLMLYVPRWNMCFPFNSPDLKILI